MPRRRASKPTLGYAVVREDGRLAWCDGDFGVDRAIPIFLNKREAMAWSNDLPVAQVRIIEAPWARKGRRRTR